MAFQPRILRQTRIRIGLSPRVRGNPGRAGRGADNSGSIPACAGEPYRVQRREGTAKVYPRVCGGTCGPSGFITITTGLSPRVRGNLERPERLQAGNGSIPACAGEPGMSIWISRWAKVYPRVCGGTVRRTSRELS